MKARLRFSYGTMNSGKSTHILTTTFNYEQNGIKFILLKPSTDTREGKSIVKSRTGLSRECVTIENNFNIYEYTIYFTSLHKITISIITKNDFLRKKKSFFLH